MAQQGSTQQDSMPVSDAERRLSELLESAPDAIFEIDEAGRILLVNRMAECLFGYDRDELLGQTLEILLPESLAMAHQKHRSRYLENPVTRPMGNGLHLKGRRRDGSHFPVEISLSPVPCDSGFHISAIVRDTTERERAAQRQRESDQQFRLMIEAVKDYAIITLDPNGVVASWNDGAQRIKQYTAGEIIGQYFSVFYPPDDRDLKPRAELEIVRATGRFEEEGWRIRKDGTPFWASVVIACVYGPDGEIVGFSKVTKDLTEPKQAADELRIVQEKYIAELERRSQDSDRANRLKTEFLSNVSHELRSPLHAILGFGELLTEETAGPLNEKQKRFLSHMQGNSQHLLELINELLDLSRIEAGQLELRQEAFHVDAVVSEAITSVGQRATSKSLNIRVNLGPPVVLFADRLRIRQILHNLLSNAVKFTPDGGEISVSVAPRGQFAEISVTDTGIGVPKDQLLAVFDKFHQVRSSNATSCEGAGLGLAITRCLVEQHGGRIWLDSEPGRGSCFTFTIPLEQRP